MSLVHAEYLKLSRRKLYYTMVLILAALVGLLAFFLLVFPRIAPEFAEGVPLLEKPEAYVFGAQQVASQTWFPLILAVIMLVLGIAQVPALIITLPAIGYIWSSGDYSHAAAIAYTVLLVLAGMADNVLKPLMLGRGVDAPMPVILIGALGGMATAGILGMFVGATLLALGYQLFMGWVAANPEAGQTEAENSPVGAES